MSTGQEDYYRPDVPEVEQADIVLLTAPSHIKTLKEDRRCIIKAKSTTLRRWSSVWADVLEVGNDHSPDQERIDGLPVIPVSEAYTPMKRFLDFFHEDIDHWPKVAQLKSEEIVETWEMSCKYQASHVMFACETHWNATLQNMWSQDAVELYIKAAAVDRNGLCKMLMPIAARGNVLRLPQKILSTVPHSTVYAMVAAQMEKRSKIICEMQQYFSAIIRMYDGARTSREVRSCHDFCISNSQEGCELASGLA